MEWFQYVVASLLLLVGAVSVVLVVLQLPGGWIMLALAVVVELLDPLYMSDPAHVTFGWWLLAAIFVLLMIGELVEFIAAVEGARRGGSSRRGMIGALIGGILGALLLTAPLAFIPVLGTLIGAIIGSFVGAVLGELSGEEARRLSGWC
jgi:uncharacterized protein YqgC (DUF456 family)